MVRLLYDKILVKPDEFKIPTTKMSKGGIIEEVVHRETVTTGTVFKVGPGRENDPMTLVAGDKVKYILRDYEEVDLIGSKYLIMRQGDIHFVFEK